MRPTLGSACAVIERVIASEALNLNPIQLFDVTLVGNRH
jgi:hypothetical protein